MAVEEVGVKLLAENADKFSRDTRAAQMALDNFVASVESGGRDIAQGADKGGDAIERLATTSETSFKKVDAFSEIAIGALRYVGEVAVDMALKAGAAIADFAADSVTVAGNYEATLNRFSAVTGDSLAEAGMDLGEFSDLFLEMGAVTQYSAGEAAQAAVNLAKGGLAPAEIAAGGLAATLSLAAAGELDLAESAEILAKQLGVWADKGVSAEEITNLLAQAANASTVDVDELANGLANVQGRAAGMGVEYQDLVQTMALISPAFESASTAGTSLNNFLARLIPATDKAEDAMRDLGLTTADGQSIFFDAQGSFIGMEQTIGLLNAATKGLSEEERSAAFSIIFGNDAMGAAIQLADSTATEYDEMGASMNAAGSATEQAALRNQGFNFALEEMRGSMETLQIVLGGALLPLLTEFIQTHITPGINRLLEFAQSIAASEDPLGTLVAKIDELLPGFSGFIDAITNAPARIAEISSAIQDEFAPEIQLAQAIFETAMTVIENITTAVMDTVMGAIDSFTSDLTTNSTTWTELARAFQGVWIALEPIIAGVLATLGALFLTLLGVIVGVFAGVLNAIDPFLAGWTMVLNFITIILEGIQELVMGFVALVVALFQGNTDGVLDALYRMQAGALTIVVGMVGGILAAVWGMISTGLAFIEGFVLGIIEFFARLYHELVGGSIIPDMVNEILAWFTNLLNNGKQLIADLVEGIKAIFDADWGAIGRNIIDGILGGITSAAGALISTVTSVASDAYDAMTGFLGGTSGKLAVDMDRATGGDVAPSVTGGAPIAGLAPSAATNNYNSTTNVYQGDSYGLNVRTTENTGSVGNTIRSLQSISRVRGAG